MRLAKILPLAVSLLLPLAARAAGPHDALQCAGCHAKRDVMAGNKVYLDPASKQPFPGTTGVCLACHQVREAGGKGNAPVARHDSHPFGITTYNPKKARVPEIYLMAGRFECMSCHDPHPSNANYKYLRTDVGKTGEKIDHFCSLCHPRKADPLQ